MHRRQAEGLQHTGPVIVAGDRLRHFCVCRPFAAQGAVTKYARSTATAASLAVYLEAATLVAAVAQSDRYLRARTPPGGPPDGITAAPLFAHLAPENCGSSQPLTIARQLRVNHETVVRVLSHAGLPKHGSPARRSQIEPYLSFIRATLEKFAVCSSWCASAAIAAVLITSATCCPSSATPAGRDLSAPGQPAGRAGPDQLKEQTDE
jgi:hypothetical protein